MVYLKIIENRLHRVSDQNNNGNAFILPKECSNIYFEGQTKCS